MLYNSFHFFVLQNKENIYRENFLKSYNNLNTKDFNTTLHLYNNDESIFKSSRNWINRVLQECYSDSEFYKNSYILLAHQDISFDSDFLDKFSRNINLIDNTLKPGLFGFAGISHQGIQHMFIKDSGKFHFTFNGYPEVCDSVDEFLFALDFNILFKEKIILSDISGWHAYSAEFSIILKNLGYLTYYLPVYVEHNSIRINNKGLLDTHLKIFKIYGYTLNTLVGKIEEIRGISLLRKRFYNLYFNWIKYKIENRFRIFYLIKHLFLDKLGLKKSNTRMLDFLIDRQNTEIIFISKFGVLPDHLRIYIDKKYVIDFYTKKSINDVLLSGKRTIICGNTDPIKGFRYLKGLNVSINF